MDSSDPQITNSKTEIVANNSSKMVLSKRDIFLTTYRSQRFSLPNSFMHYIAKNPKNAKFYQKMVKRCKYFFIKNPILVLSYLCYVQNGGEYWVINGRKSMKMNKFSCKLWITDDICVYGYKKIKKTIASSIIPIIYQCDVIKLSLYEQVISLNEFKILCLSAEVLDLHEVTVKYEDGIVVALEKLIEQLLKVKRFYHTFKTPSNNISKNTFKKLWKIPHLSNYDSFCLFNIPEDFDIHSFYSFMKKNKKTPIYLKFSDEISEAYKTRLEAIVDEIIGTKNHGYKPPYIEFPGIDREKLSKLKNIFCG